MSDEQRSKALVPPAKSPDKAPQRATPRTEGRLAALRQAIAHTDPKDGDTKRALFIALADAITIRLKDSIRADQREQLEFEQANALFHGRAYDRAGACFEALGRLELAARCYRQAGAIEELEAVYERQEQAKQNAQTSDQFQQTLDKAFRTGRRNLVLTQCEAMLHDTQLSKRYPELMTRLNTRQREILNRTPRSHEAKVRIHPVSSPQRSILLRYFWDQRIVSGRSPGVQLPLSDQSLSREHLAFSFSSQELTLQDLGSKTGTFLDGDAVYADEPVTLWPEQTYDVGLGMHANLEVHVMQPHQGAVVIDPQAPNTWNIFGVERLALFIPTASEESFPGTRVDALTLHRCAEHRALHLSVPPRELALHLGPAQIDATETIQLLTQDKLTFEYEDQSWSVEVLA